MNEHDFYARSVVDKLLDYKKSIIFITILFITLTFIYILFSQKVYRTDATLEVISKYNPLGISEDRGAENEYERHFVTQMDFLQSRYLVSQVIKKLQLNINYFQNGGIKPYSILPDEPPFLIKNLKVKDDSFYQKMFHIKQIDHRHYALRLVPDSNIESKLFTEDRSSALVYQFSKPVVSDFLEFTIEKNPYVDAEELYFNIEHTRDHVDKVLRNLTVVKNSFQSSIIKIIYDDNSPIKAQQFVNALLKEYMRMSVGQQMLQSNTQLKLINEELESEKYKLAQVERVLQSFVEKNRVAGMTQQTNNLINSISKYENQLEDLEMRHQLLKSLLHSFQKSYDYKNVLTQIAQLGNSNLIKLADTIAKEEEQYKILRKKYKNRHPSIMQIKKSIAQKSITLEQNIKLLLKDAKVKRVKLRGYLDKYKTTLTTVPQKEIGFAKLKREYDLVEKNYLLLLEKKRQLDITKKVQGDYTYRILDYAFLPEIHTKPKKSLLLVLGSILGLLFALFYALVRAYFAKKITVPSEVEELTRLPYLGTIPYVKDKQLYNDLFVAKDPDSIASQMMWSLRDRIDSFGMKGQGQVIAITSMVKGEGKTTLAANLSIALGMGDKKTIILSLDLRLPEIHTKFELDNSLGLSSVLFGNKKLADVTYQSNQFPNLYVVPSGPQIENPMKVINSNYIDIMITKLKEQYDYIIIDLPPAGIAAESLFLMKKADLVLSVLKSKYSEKSFVTYMENIVVKNNIKNIGFVLNGVNKKYIKIIARKENRKYIDQNRKFTDSLKNRQKHATSS